MSVRNLTIKSLKLKNWLCFRGEHVLDLRSIAYAVTARFAEDEGRSNGGGKTAVVEAPPFALFGVHRRRTEDEWISTGENIGGVEMILTDSHTATDPGDISEVRVLRERHRGKRTVLHVDVGSRHMMGDVAQAFLVEMLCLSEQDFRATCWFEQRQMARLVLAEPAKRMRIVGGWLELEPLERCAENAGRRLLKALDDVGTRLSAITAREELLAQIMRAPDGGALTLDGLKAHFIRCLDAAKAASADYDEVDALIEENRRRYQLSVEAGEFDSVGNEIRVLVDSIGRWGNADALQREAGEAGEALTAAGVATGLAFKDVQDKKKVAAGEFDGICPVALVACPIREQINADRGRARDLYDAAVTKYRLCEEAERVVRETYIDRLAKRDAWKRDADRLENLRERYATLQPKALESAKCPVRDAQALGSRCEAARARLDEAHLAHTIADRALNQAVRLTNEVEESLGLRAEMEARLVHLRAAVQVFGKNGAQRAFAEGELGEIEAEANGALAEAGIALQVAVTWGREGSGPAKVCDACGTAFPASHKVKACGRCGAERGPHVVNRLDIVPSDSSGGCDDLGSAFTQLAAAAWLRAERGSTWGCALLDELWAQLDQTNRRALTTHVAGLLRDRYAFPQALVVAHHDAVLDALPGRILVEREGRWSKVRVI